MLNVDQAITWSCPQENPGVAPEKDAFQNPEGCSDCSGTGDGGHWASIRRPEVYIGFGGPSGLGGPGASERGTSNSGQNWFKTGIATATKACLDGRSDMVAERYVLYRDCRGRCQIVGPIEENGVAYPFGDGYTLTSWPNFSGGNIYEVADPGGGTTTYTPFVSGDTSTIGPREYRDANGQVTTFNRDATTNAITSVRMANGDTWGYADTTGTGGEKVTTVTTPGGLTTMVVTYGPPGSATAAKPVSTVVKNQSGATVSTTTYT